MSDRPASLTQPPDGYAEWPQELKKRIQTTQQSAALATNREMVMLYWRIGRDILERQAAQGWGAKVIDRLSHDLRVAFPDMKGFSRTNLLYMRSFAEAWPDEGIVQQAVGRLPWGHNVVLLTKLKDREQRLAYAQKTIEHGWSRNVLVMQIESRLLERQGAALTNFEERLPHPQSDLARESLKDPYRFDFLGLTEKAQEREIELKAGDFKPEHLGQLGFYLTAVDRQIKTTEDRPTIGLLLCRSKNKVVAEYALGDNTQPMGIAEYKLRESLPESLETSLPSIEQIERELTEGDA